jgi:spore maturation protein CgeB
VRGVRYPRCALAALQTTNLEYGGWIANADAPIAFAQHRATLHIPRRHYVDALPGIPTIRMFEALACGVPLISAPWEDAENLFRPGKDFLFARNGEELTHMLQELLHDPERRSELASAGLETIKTRHTCRHRANELLAIIARVSTLRVRQQLASREAAE